MASSVDYVPDRQLIAKDLDRLASALSPLIASRLESTAAAAIESLETSEALTVKVFGLAVNVAPMVGRMVRAKLEPALPQLRESVTPQLSASLRGLLGLSDADLSTLCETVAAELGAWVGVREPVEPDLLGAAAAPLAVLVGGDGR
jgi:hypothetical protein